ncbi:MULTISPECIES: type VI secretion system Vgr family protein [unclassified Sphingomonas]|uniref:type VI secretion system Vgr family protein n=1 Tax=unclassified Sphingomonas TaxID=196159 RepID=UPI00082D6C23|nr:MULTISPECIES: type VI secretion system tip protein TssI/VgrG [unclassified Sphingomonas]
MGDHLLNLRALPDDLANYELLGFEGREAISEPFEYRLELVAGVRPDLTQWIGKLVEFDISIGDFPPRVFAGRIYAARLALGAEGMRVLLTARPAYFALSYARATHFIQDKTSLDIFTAMTADVVGLTKSVGVSPDPPARGYAVRYDESELDFLDRLLAQDGIMYFFVHDSGAGTFRHKMVLANKSADYVDVAGGDVSMDHEQSLKAMPAVAREYRAGPRKHKHHGVNVNKLDEPFTKAGSAAPSWGAVYPHGLHSIGFESVAQAGVNARSAYHIDGVGQSADQVTGMSSRCDFMAGGRVKVTQSDGALPDRLAFTSVTHSARDPWMLQDGGKGSYSNQFTAIDATRVFRPPVGAPQRTAPGPLLGTVADESSAKGEIVIDDQSRVPVEIATARDYGGALPKFVWLPVQQQWAHSTHGAQFFPRIGTRVIIDFLYGNPDLPFISGTVYTPSQPYPFDPASAKTQSGWRSVTEKNGGITQEFRFEDKDGAEEIYLYTGRDYRRLIDNDDWGTVKRDQTLAVERDQSLTVTRDRTVKIDGKQTTDIAKTRTVTVQQKSLLESKQEIELKVGSSTITMTPTGIEIKAVKITIKAEAQLDMSGGATAALKAPKTDVTADAMLTLKGGIVMIN